MIHAFHHPGFAAPIGKHIMPMRKFALVAEAIRDVPGVQVIEPDPVAIEDLLRVHTAEYVEAVRTGEPRALAESQKFPWSESLYPSVLLTNGGCVAAARSALDDGIAAALASGFHHSHADHGEGFCTFNGLVIAHDALRSEGRLRSTVVLDMDLHYGNGTASLCRSRPELFNLSIYGNDYADNRPHPDVTERHHEDGENHRSIALPRGCDRATMLAAMDVGFEILRDRWRRHGRPDLLLYQAGADPFREDPYSPLELDLSDLLERDRRVFAFTRSEEIPVAWVLAGGYTEDVAQVVKVHRNTCVAAAEVYR